ncbi:MAG: CDP-diacylglycerol--glycerol-3-phosphate 3-phosphatidyltransferase [Alphaproteobacteria bacterium]
MTGKQTKNKIKNTIKKAPAAAKKVATPIKKINIPNLLTLVRIWAIPAIVLTFFIPTAFWAWTGVVLFAIAGITDYMDGYLARHLNQLSRFGRVLDPIADKLLVGSILLMLAFSGRLGYVGILPAVVILCREILVSGLREFLAEIKIGCPVTRLAKWKTACQMTALPVLMVSTPIYSGFLGHFFWGLGMIALWGAAILTVMTGYDYWKSGRKYMDED